MIAAISILHVSVSLFMILVILLQAGKSGGIGGLAGGSGSVFGGRGSQTILSKITTACAAIFMATSLTLAWFSSRSDSMVTQRLTAAAEKKAAETKAAEAKPEDAAKPEGEAAPAADAPKADAPAADAPKADAPAADAPKADAPKADGK